MSALNLYGADVRSMECWIRILHWRTSRNKHDVQIQACTLKHNIVHPTSLQSTYKVTLKVIVLKHRTSSLLRMQPVFKQKSHRSAHMQSSHINTEDRQWPLHDNTWLCGATFSVSCGMAEERRRDKISGEDGGGEHGGADKVAMLHLPWEIPPWYKHSRWKSNKLTREKCVSVCEREFIQACKEALL